MCVCVCVCVECDSCVHLLVDDVELLEHNVTSMIDSLENINVGVLAMRRLQRINTSVIELRPLVDLLTTSPTDPTQLDPIKRELAGVQRHSDAVTIRVRPCDVTHSLIWPLSLLYVWKLM